MTDPSDQLRVLLLNEGNLGTHILGQGQLDAALRAPLEGMPDVETRFVGLGPMGRWSRAAALKTVAPLERAALDGRPLRWHLVQARRARRLMTQSLADWPADVVHVHSHSIALTLGGMMRTVPTVLSVDTTIEAWWSMPAWRPPQRHARATIAPSLFLERRAFERAAFVLAWTAWACRDVESAAPGARVVEHHPGLDLQRYRPASREPRALPRLLFVGGRFKEKGGEDLLDAIGPALGRELEVDLVTPEDVPAREGLRLHRLQPGDARLLELQQQADLMCLPTYGDAAPWAVLEALACGTPVVATPVGGLPDLLGAGEAGVLVPGGAPRELAEAVRTLLGDPARRAAHAASGRQRCEQHYDASQQASRLVKLLRQARDETAAGALSRR